jgi:sugar-specific transcriptional regulator TrmB
MQEKTMHSLQKLGLSSYESQVYLSLTKIITGTPYQISVDSHVPRSKVYDVLKRLNNKGYVDVEQGRPLKYTVVPPRDIFKKEKEKLIEELNESEKILNDTYENQISQVQAPVWLIRNQQKIIKKELEIISRTKKTLNMRIGFLFENEAEQLKKAFQKISKNVEINILASPFCYVNHEKVDIISSLENPNINIYKADIPFVKMMIRDSIEIMHIYTKFSGKKKSVLPDISIGIWNQYQDVAKNYDDRFKDQITKKRKKQNK